jgi:hypothetical protein
LGHIIDLVGITSDGGNSGRRSCDGRSSVIVSFTGDCVPVGRVQSAFCAVFQYIESLIVTVQCHILQQLGPRICRCASYPSNHTDVHFFLAVPVSPYRDPLWFLSIPVPGSLDTVRFSHFRCPIPLLALSVFQSPRSCVTSRLRPNVEPPRPTTALFPLALVASIGSLGQRLVPLLVVGKQAVTK